LPRSFICCSGSDWGIGDFGDLRRLVELAADAGLTSLASTAARDVS